MIKNIKYRKQMIEYIDTILSAKISKWQNIKIDRNDNFYQYSRTGESCLCPDDWTWEVQYQEPLKSSWSKIPHDYSFNDYAIKLKICSSDIKWLQCNFSSFGWLQLAMNYDRYVTGRCVLLAKQNWTTCAALSLCIYKLSTKKQMTSYGPA